MGVGKDIGGVEEGGEREADGGGGEREDGEREDEKGRRQGRAG